MEDAEKVQITTEKQTKGDIPEYVEKFTVHVKTDKSWENPCLWAWSAPDGKNVFDAWPGEALTPAENGWYEAEVPVWINSLIVKCKGRRDPNRRYLYRSCRNMGDRGSGRQL